MRAFLLAALALHAGLAGAATPASCLRAAGTVGLRCLAAYTRALAPCRLAADAGCEAAARADGGDAARALAAVGVAEAACPDAAAEPLGFLSSADVALRLREGCADWGDDLLRTAVSPDPAGLPPALLLCRRETARRLAFLALAAARVESACDVAAFRGTPCARARRDAHLDALAAAARRRIERRCGGLDPLHLGTPATLVATVRDHAHHYALLVTPPNDLGPTAEFGPYPVGITTLPLVDPTRTNVKGTAPRPVTLEVYYPSTPAAVAGHPKDVATVLGVPLIATPAYRDVARAPGTFPLVVFSHGSNGVRIQSFFFAAHLASHGYVVASPDHHGNTFPDTLAGDVDPNAFVNRPLDISFVIDRLTLGDVPLTADWAGALDASRIGVSGHSFGGYTAYALASGTFRDPRVRAIFPQAPFSEVFDAAFFAGVAIPSFTVGGTIDETTPFDANQQRAFDLLPATAPVTGLAALTDAGHFTFSDFCEVPRTLLAFLGGFSEACEPRHLTWRHAHQITNYLALNFFDATLRDDPAALGRLAPAVANRIEDLHVTVK